MAGTLVANTINTDTGLFNTQNAYQGIAKAWVTFVGSTAVINGSFNVSSVTRNGTGDYTINFTTAMSNINYSSIVGISYVTSYIAYCNTNGSGTIVAPTTSAFRMAIINYNGTNVSDATYVNVAILGA